MPFQNSGQTGSQPIAATQLAQEFFVDTTDVDYVAAIPVLLTRGAPRILVLATQTSGAVPAELQLQVCISNQDGVVVPERKFINLGAPILTPLNVPIAIDRPVPTKYLRVLITKPGANHVVVDIAVMAAQ